MSGRSAPPRSIWAGLAPLFATVAFVALPPATLASTLGLAGGAIAYDAEGQEANKLSISVVDGGASYEFSDSGANIFPPDPPCSQPSPAPPRAPATCPVAGVTGLRVRLFDGSDELTVVEASFPPGLAPPIAADGGDDVATDTLSGGPGPDALSGGPGDDMLHGGGGNDRLDYPIAGGSPDPSAGADLLDGGPGDDVLNGGPPRSPQDPDVLIGGDGRDTADYRARTAPLTITLDDARGDGEPSENDDVRADVEDVIGGAGGDTVIGSSAGNLLDGRLGSDTLIGGDGDDTLDGGENEPGSDILRGDGGNDTLLGREGDDNLDGGPGDDLLPGGGGTDTIRGGPGNDRLDGGPGTDDLIGGEGDDVLNGGDSADTLDGGLGDDVISGGDGTDTVTYAGRSGDVRVSLNGSADDGERGEHDNVDADVEIVKGGTSDDTLRGDAAANTLEGGAGEDLIDGDAGADTLRGGDAPDLLDARDGSVGDVVECGGGPNDLALIDAGDITRGCGTIDRPGRRPVAVGRTAVVRAVGREAFALRLPTGKRIFEQFKDPTTIAVGSTIDAEDGPVRVATAKNGAGDRQEITASGAIFTVGQEKRSKPVTELVLVGGKVRGCGRGSKAARAARPPPPDPPPGKLTTSIGKKRRGSFRVRGKYSRGAAIGTSWTTVETCKGTRTIVHTGTVRVTPCGSKKTVEVRPGRPFTTRKHRCRR